MPRKGSARLPQFGGYGSCFANALRAMRIIQQRLVAYRSTRHDVMLWMLEEFHCSRATAYRLAAAAIDVLELSLAEDAPDVVAPQHMPARSRPDWLASEFQHFGRGRPITGLKTSGWG
jgi:hypothetical protein